jgi:hypothetical protein
VFLARSGTHARAVFGSRDEAKRFAERHARTFVPETPIMWQDGADFSALETAIGEYLVTSIDDPGSVGCFAKLPSRKVGVGLRRHRRPLHFGPKAAARTGFSSLSGAGPGEVH